MSRCRLCRRPCIPMADYDEPVCYQCDADCEDRRMRRFTRPHKTLPEWAAKLPLSFRSGPGRPEDIAELLAVFGSSKPGRKAERRRL